MYKVVFTHQAARAAKAKSSLETVEERVRSEIDAILMDDMALSQLIFHAVEMEDGRKAAAAIVSSRTSQPKALRINGFRAR